MHVQTATLIATVLSGLALMLCMVVVPIIIYDLQEIYNQLNGDMSQFDLEFDIIWKDMQKLGGGTPALRNRRQTYSSWPPKGSKVSSPVFGSSLPSESPRDITGRSRPELVGATIKSNLGHSCNCDAVSELNIDTNGLLAGKNNCPAGPPGPKGPPGNDGPNGYAGMNGMPGQEAADVVVQIQEYEQCFHCPHGPIGPPGAPGRKGPRGMRGARGSDGMPGRNGPPGSPGEFGNPGGPGRDGQAGPQGEPGQDGTAGHGLAGPKGNRGRRGKAGEKGGIGEDGVPGQIGPPGPAGPIGFGGIAGVAGGSGPAGEPGEPGQCRGSGKSLNCGECPRITGNDAQYCSCPRRTKIDYLQVTN